MHGALHSKFDGISETAAVKTIVVREEPDLSISIIFTELTIFYKVQGAN